MLPRTNGWWFYDLGRHLERADNTSRILDIKYFMILPSLQAVGSALDMVQWASVLRSCSAFEAFRRSRRGDLDLVRVVDYLIRDQSFPRSIVYSLTQAEHSLTRISASNTRPHVAAAQSLLRQLSSDLANSDTKTVVATGLHEYLDALQTRIELIHDAIQLAYIDHATAA